MFENLYIKLLMLIASIIDSSNKKKIIEFFKKHYKNKPISVLDIGSHKGETIDYLIKNFNIHQIYSCEPNLKLFLEIKKNKKYQNDNIKLFNVALGNSNEKKTLNVFKDTSSSTFNIIDINTKYFERKKKIINYFSESDNYFLEKQIVQVHKTSDFIKNNLIANLNILKIDTEGYELNILQGIDDDQFKFIEFIFFEHHYDLMIKKKYKFKDINELLLKKGFKKYFKTKMKFRKAFEYIYKNEK